MGKQTFSPNTVDGSWQYYNPVEAIWQYLLKYKCTDRLTHHVDFWDFILQIHLHQTTDAYVKSLQHCVSWQIGNNPCVLHLQSD